MGARDLTALVHLVGFMTGIVLYAMLGIMTRRRLAHVVAQGESRFDDRVPLAAAALGVVWNVGAMAVFAGRDFGVAVPSAWIGAIAYTALGFLPAVVVHSTLRRGRRSGYLWFLRVAYSASAIAGVFHLVDAARGEMPSPLGLLLLTVTYSCLLTVLAVSERGRPGFQRSITAVALAAFAVSALHLSRHAGVADQDPWWMELIGHHASLPLVLAILYQDYRFAFADLFLKRALALLVLVVGVSLLYAELAAPLVDPHARGGEPGTGAHLFTTAALVALWVATALGYPLVQRRVYRFVDRIILRRADYRVLRTTLGQRLADASDADAALVAACALLAEALGARAATWSPMAAGSASPQPMITLDVSRTAATISVPTATPPSYEFRIAELGGARSLLSDDLMLIDTVAALVGRRIDALRVETERRVTEAREQEMRRLATVAELRALRAQLNPHFLFNALNTLGHLMQAAPDRALTTLYRLTALLRAVLRRTDGQFVSLSDELEIVEAYLAIERERFEERLQVEIDVPSTLRRARVPPLVVQPLVENAVKHGIAPVREGGRVIVRVRRDVTNDDADGFLRLTVVDTGVGVARESLSRPDGVGLTNVESRLRHYFGGLAAMSVRETPGGGTTVEICIPWIARDQVAPMPA
jgi:two-component sensor histidine kinase